MADGASGPGPGSGSGSDDEFDRQLRALTEGSAGKARFKELSAAERAKAGARQAKQASKLAKQNARQRRKQAKQNARQGRRAGKREGRPGGQEGRPGGGRRMLTGWLVLVAILAVSGGLAYLRLGHRLNGGPDDTQAVRHGALPTISGSSSLVSPVSPHEVLSGPPTDPFATVPADHWADDAAGIVLPTARPTGTFSAAKVATAYLTTRKLLIAANLDEPTLLGGAPNAFTDLLTRQQRTLFVANLDKTGLDKHGYALSTRNWLTSFAPGTTRLIGSVIKVHGTMSAHATTDQGGRKVLEVDVNYRFVYPVEPPGLPADWMRVVTQVSGSVLFGAWAQASTPFEPFVQFTNRTAGGRCGVNDGFVHPDFPNGPADKVQPSGPAVDPYSMATQPASNTCGAVTRT